VKQETQKLSVIQMLHAVLSTGTQNTLKYHLLSVKPSFAVKIINSLHRTGPTGRKMERLDMSLTCCTIIWELFFTKPGVKTDIIAGISYYLNKY